MPFVQTSQKFNYPSASKFFSKNLEKGKKTSSFPRELPATAH